MLRTRRSGRGKPSPEREPFGLPLPLQRGLRSPQRPQLRADFSGAHTDGGRRRQRSRFLSGPRMRSWLGPEVTAAAGPQARAHATAPGGFAKGAIVFSVGLPACARWARRRPTQRKSKAGRTVTG